MKILKSIGNLAAELLLPSSCLDCGVDLEKSGVVCEKCLKKIKINQTFFCGECKARLPEAKKICHQPFPYLLAAAGDYRDPTLQKIILGLKFKFYRGAATALGEILIDYIKKIGFVFDGFVIIPIPLHKTRERERGFNQSLLLSKIVAKELGIELAEQVLKRTRNTEPQSGIKDFQKKLRNVSDCFQVVYSEKINGRKILLIDDVTTSGATFLAAAEILKKAGAGKIIALAAAKA
ncbi:MAG: phosphoribosyltransferase family protein [Candidatus Paceibacterota bacterium]|jgi:ComF family protein